MRRTGTRRVRAWPVLLLGALLLPVGYLASPPDAPPLYDGVAAPDEPYRYLVPTAASVAARGATETVALTRAGSAAIELATEERGPQAVLLVPRFGVDVSGVRAGALTATARPVRPPEPLPVDGRVLTIGYALGVRAQDGRELALSGRGGRPEVELRIPQGTEAPVAIELFTDGGWERLATRRIGFDGYAADLPALGVVVAVQVTDRAASAGAAGGNGPLLPLLGLGGLVVLGAAVALTRQRSGSAAAPAGDGPPR